MVVCRTRDVGGAEEWLSHRTVGLAELIGVENGAWTPPSVCVCVCEGRS